MTLREQKLLTIAEYNALLSSLGPCRVKTVEEAGEAPYIRIVDSNNFATYHYLVSDLLANTYATELAALPADEQLTIPTITGVSFTLAVSEDDPIITGVTDGETLDLAVGATMTAITVTNSDETIYTKDGESIEALPTTIASTDAGEYTITAENTVGITEVSFTITIAE